MNDNRNIIRKMNFTFDRTIQVADCGHKPRFKKPHKGNHPKTNRNILNHHQMIIAILIISTLVTILTLPLVAHCDLQPQQTDQSKSQSQSQPQQVEQPEEQQFTDEESLKVSALAARLAQWVACRRSSSVMYQHLQLHQSTNIASTSSNETQIHPQIISSNFNHKQHSKSGKLLRRRSGSSLSQEPESGCPAHYDGHLCWPAARAGETVHLQCPEMPQLPSQNKKQPVINENQSMSENLLSATSLTLSQVAAADSKLEKSIKRSPTEAPAITQPVQGAEVRYASRRCQVVASGIAQQQPKQLERRRRRKHASGKGANDSTPIEHLVVEPTKARWQTEPDYGACWMATNGLHFDPTDKWIKLDQEPDKRLFATLADELDRIETTIDPYSDPDWLDQWFLCIGKIMRQQSSFVATQNTVGDPWCPIIFDGWRCWPPTRASETAYVSCPSNQPGFSAERKAHKICTEDGTWYRHPMTNRYWSNYTTCVDTVDLAFRTKILNLYVIGNIISLVALSASLIIFVSFKSLNCTRVTIHKNLFLSFITNNLMWIIWYTYVVSDADLLQSNPIECQLWHVLLHYFLVSNYFWMFCEGLYLYTLLEVAFVSENKILKWFYLLGWLTPVPITVAYAYQRSQDQEFTQFCWMEESPYNQILVYPIVISLVLNFIFLINIVRVLVNKLKASNSNAPDTHQTRKAVRATLILIPLLGLHYLLTPMRPEPKSEWEVIYESMAAVCTSFQGLCVAMLFCFCNGEVITAIKRKLRDSFKFHSRFGQDPFQPMRSRSNTTCTTAAGYFSPNNNNNNAGGDAATTPMPTFTNHRKSNGGFRLCSPSSADTQCNNGQRQHLLDKPCNNLPLISDIPNSQRGSNTSSALTTVTLSPIVTRKSSTNGKLIINEPAGDLKSPLLNDLLKQDNNNGESRGIGKEAVNETLNLLIEETIN